MADAGNIPPPRYGADLPYVSGKRDKRKPTPKEEKTEKAAEPARKKAVCKADREIMNQKLPARASRRPTQIKEAEIPHATTAQSGKLKRQEEPETQALALTGKESITDRPPLQESVLERRKTLCEKWNDKEIFFAGVDFLLSEMEEEIRKRSKISDRIVNHGFGSSCFTWKEDQADTLILLIKLPQEGTSSAITSYEIKILENGTLHFQGKIFKSPNEVLSDISKQHQLFNNRISFFPAIQSALMGEIPPDIYIEMVVPSLIKRGDCLSAKQAIENYLKTDQNDPFRVIKIYVNSAKAALQTKNYGFLRYLIEEHDVLQKGGIFDNIGETLIRDSIAQKDIESTMFLLEASPPEYQQKMLDTAFHHATEKDMIEALLEGYASLCTQLHIPIVRYLEMAGLQPTLNLLVNLGYEINHAMVQWLFDSLLSAQGNIKFDPTEFLKFVIKNRIEIAQLDPTHKKKLYLMSLQCPNGIQLATDLWKNFNELGDPNYSLLKDSFGETKSIILKFLKSVNYEIHTWEIQDVLQDKYFIRDYLSSIIELTKDEKIARSLLSGIFCDGRSQDFVQLIEKFPQLKTDTTLLIENLRLIIKNSTENAVGLFGQAIKIFADPHKDILESHKVIAAIKQLEDSESEKNDISDVSIENIIQTYYLDYMFQSILHTSNSQPINKIKEMLEKHPKWVEKFWSRCIQNGPKTFHPEWKELAKATLPILNPDQMNGVLSEIFSVGYVGFAHLIFENSSSKLSEGTVKDLFTSAIRVNEPELVRCLVKVFPVNSRFSDDTCLLDLAIMNNSASIVSVLLELGANLQRDSTHESPLQKAIDKDYLSIACLIDRDVAINKFIDMLVTTSDLKKSLMHIFLNSFSQDVFELIQKMSSDSRFDEKRQEELREFTNFLGHQGTLIARFPSDTDQSQMYYEYGVGKYDNYDDQQIDFANRRYAVYQKVFTQLRNLSLFDTYQELAGARKGADEFSRWRINAGSIPIGTGMIRKYQPFVKLAYETVRDAKFAPESLGNRACEHSTENQSGYKGTAILHPLSSDENIELTTILLDKNQKFWNHTGFEEFVKIYNKASGLYEELVVTTEIPPENLKRKIAELYWLLIHMIPVIRGNSQYSLEIHNMLYEHHGYEVGCLSQQFVLPDCVALCMPFEQFYKKYYDKLFEIPPRKKIAA